MPFQSLINNLLTYLVNPIIYGMVVLATIIFLWGVMEYIKNANDATKRKDGQSHMIWGVVGLAIMISFNGIINILINIWK